MPKPTESTFELATIQRLQALGYRHVHGCDLDRALHEVVLVDELRDYLQRRYRYLPADAIKQAEAAYEDWPLAA